ncbi:hypothetical protein [Alkalilimnicola sp. S0819]|uniref:hypothetical protein n=1 Tax=Alkalilimnicola sp. S0819 TaxID=2613922 RepID=UPI00126169FF|nr:hypothetical protein [Alkalilimnicola sp. S0819]KAB7624103.1 hypothetical protein F3N43_06860 [Alkalilimnicola sp. S0819]MPQ16354.1 hypothetical protein [Alkalilimnicola sp. S0819]
MRRTLRKTLLAVVVTVIASACALASDPRFFDLVVPHADPDFPDTYDMTALFDAVAYCDEERVGVLLAKGADRRAETRDGKRPEDFAKRLGREAMARRLGAAE